MDYSRQSPIFNQEMLKRGNVAIVGGGAIANYVCTYLCGLGVGNIKLIDNEYVESNNNEFLHSLDGKRDGLRKVILKKVMLKMNDEINIEDKLDILYDSDVIVELTNDPISKKRYKKIADELNTCCNSNIRLVISLSSDFNSGSIAVYKPIRKLNPIEKELCINRSFSKDNLVSKLLKIQHDYDYFPMEEYAGKEQGNFSSGIMAALCVNEIRKVLSPLDLDYPIQKLIHFDLSSIDRFNTNGNKNKQEFGRDIDLNILKQKKVLIIGAGGTGTYTALNLVLLSFGCIDIYDGDTVEDHNRNRQVFYFGKVGEPKATSLAERLSKMNPVIKINGYNEFIDENSIQKLKTNGYDIIFSCVDRWTPRKLLNDLAVMTQTPLFDCAASLYGGRVTYFIPGKNKSLREVFNLEDLVKRERPRTNHCNPSMIVPNAIIGSINVAEALALLFPTKYVFNYDRHISFNDITNDSNKLLLRNIN